MKVRIVSYDKFLQEKIVFPETNICFFGGCSKPGLYKGGNERFLCGMCEEHARMPKVYGMYVSDKIKSIRKKVQWRNEEIEIEIEQ